MPYTCQHGAERFFSPSAPWKADVSSHTCPPERREHANRTPSNACECSITAVTTAAAAGSGDSTGDSEIADMAMESKVKVLIRRLKEIKESDATAKSLIFSHFQATINWIKTKLTQSGFSFRTLSGDMTLSQRSKALADFQTDPPTTVFLLSIRSGACGINLTQANQVFLMEPCLNPALEQQAIGRVHRMGQKRVVNVWKLVMKNSVETQVMKLQKRKAESTDDDAAAGATGSAPAASASAAGSASEPRAKKKKQSAKASEHCAGQMGSIMRDSNQSLKVDEFEFLLQ